MNSIKQITSGLASSLFLAAGLTRLAEKADPTFKQNKQALTKVHNPESCEFSTFPCQFTPESGQ